MYAKHMWYISAFIYYSCQLAFFLHVLRFVATDPRIFRSEEIATLKNEIAQLRGGAVAVTVIDKSPVDNNMKNMKAGRLKDRYCRVDVVSNKTSWYGNNGCAMVGRCYGLYYYMMLYQSTSYNVVLYIISHYVYFITLSFFDAKNYVSLSYFT